MKEITRGLAKRKGGEINRAKGEGRQREKWGGRKGGQSSRQEAREGWHSPFTQACAQLYQSTLISSLWHLLHFYYVLSFFFYFLNLKSIN